MSDDDIAAQFSLENIMHNTDRNELNADCQRWALAHGKCVDLYFYLLSYFCFNLFKGFVQRSFPSNDETYNDSIVIPYPFTIYPSPYPRDEYEKAYQIQYGINTLVQRLAFDIDLMDSVLQK
jgi:hypothetical protein